MRKVSTAKLHVNFFSHGVNFGAKLDSAGPNAKTGVSGLALETDGSVLYVSFNKSGKTLTSGIPLASVEYVDFAPVDKKA